MARRQARSRGAASVQLVLVMPALLSFVLLVIQMALWQHAGHVVTAAAQVGVREAQGEHASARIGRQAADAFVRRAGRGLVTDVRLTATRTSTTSRVVVRGRALSLVPGFHLPVVGTAEAPTERFIAVTHR